MPDDNTKSPLPGSSEKTKPVPKTDIVEVRDDEYGTFELKIVASIWQWGIRPIRTERAGRGRRIVFIFDTKNEKVVEIRNAWMTGAPIPVCNNDGRILLNATDEIKTMVHNILDFQE